ncbi:hypothetical protein Q5752_000544 [Cryptotrichosporon argae]
MFEQLSDKYGKADKTLHTVYDCHDEAPCQSVYTKLKGPYDSIRQTAETDTKLGLNKTARDAVCLAAEIAHESYNPDPPDLSTAVKSFVMAMYDNDAEAIGKLHGRLTAAQTAVSNISQMQKTLAGTDLAAVRSIVSNVLWSSITALPGDDSKRLYAIWTFWEGLKSGNDNQTRAGADRISYLLNASLHAGNKHTVLSEYWPIVLGTLEKTSFDDGLKRRVQALDEALQTQFDEQCFERDRAELCLDVVRLAQVRAGMDGRATQGS